MTICSQYLRNVEVKLPTIHDGKVTLSKIQVDFDLIADWKPKMPLLPQMFKLFPILITILLVWSLCAILTAAGALPEKDGARTDTNIQLLYKADWFRIPYPCEY